MKITALAGGVGGAKLAHGLAQHLKPEELTIIVNTGDDFEHLGLYICPDLDTVCYTLAGLANPETGWGRANETWNVIGQIEKLGGPGWFRLGDADLATHIERTRKLKEGALLSEIARGFCKAWGVSHEVLPMTDTRVATIVNTDEGELAFQEYFVHRRCEPRVKSFRFENANLAQPAPGVLEAIQSADAVVICPSNPWVSIDPILSIPKIRPALEGKTIIAVSPIIGGKAVKGPAAKMYAELGIEPSALAVAKHYQHLLNGYVFDTVDADLEKDIKMLGIEPLVTNTVMNQLTDRAVLAGVVLDFIGSL